MGDILSEKNYNFDKSNLILWAIIGNSLIFIISMKNISDFLSFDLVISTIAVIIFDSYAFLVLRISKIEIMLIFVFGIIFGVVLPIICVTIFSSIFY